MQLLLGAVGCPEGSVIRESLLAYCKRDTWGVVRLLHRLRELTVDG